MLRDGQAILTPEEIGELKSALDVGVCLLALHTMREYGLPCVSDAELLVRLRGVDVTDPAIVRKEILRHQELALAYLTDGLLLHHGNPEDPL